MAGLRRRQQGRIKALDAAGIVNRTAGLAHVRVGGNVADYIELPLGIATTEPHTVKEDYWATAERYW